MTETEPGRTKPDSTWGGTWTTITKADYDKAIAEASGLSGLSVFASATRPNGDDYTYTAWGLKGADAPLIASELRDCGPDWSRVPSANCPGSHTFWSFTPWPQWRCGPCGETVRRERPQCRASVMHCEECGTALTEVAACRHCDKPIERCRVNTGALGNGLCKGWRHVGSDSQPVIGHCCGGRLINPAAEPEESAT